MAASKRKVDDFADSVHTKCRKSSFMESVCCYILGAGIQKVRMNIFKSQLEKFGGTVSESLSKEITHVIVDDKIDTERLQRLLNLNNDSSQFSDFCVVKSQWLSQCFKQKELLPTKLYEILFHKKNQEVLTYLQQDVENDSVCASTSSKRDYFEVDLKQDYPKDLMDSACEKHNDLTEMEVKRNTTRPKYRHGDSDYASSDDDIPTNLPERIVEELPVGHWVCAHSSKSPSKNFNEHITDQLEEMVHTYESTNDKWRAYSYQKAIQALKKHNKRITSWEESKSLPGIGKRLADKIWEIAQSGSLRKLETLKSSEDIKVITLFSDVWGAGPTTARAWYQMGFRSLDDLLTKANLTKQQKIGLKHYYDFLDRMSYAEAGEIHSIVRQRAESLMTGAVATACGSYRRGKATCGDVDILLTHPDGHSHTHLFTSVLASLKQDGFLTDDLVSVEVNRNQKKYMGVCKLEGDAQKFRRIDIIAVPHNEYACALMHFTGSAHFNRSIRHLAKKLNMSLSEHSLRIGVVRTDGEKIHGGAAVPTPTEESIFKLFGLPYQAPEDRDH